jgi:hypothetical protein
MVSASDIVAPVLHSVAQPGTLSVDGIRSCAAGSRIASYFLARRVRVGLAFCFARTNQVPSFRI